MKLRVPGVAAWLSVLALIYALFAGLKTVVDFDLGWQMATARYAWEQHSIPSTELFSYTAYGASWIYPIFSGAMFYAAYQIGGYAAISWLCALICVLTIGVLSVRRSLWATMLTVLAVPVTAEQAMPRSGLFTVLLFAAFARLLLDYLKLGTGRLWILPLLMIGWVNLHLGFIGGIALIGAYLFLEACELAFTERRDAAISRLKNAWPWLILTALATLVNPWGWRIWGAAVPQEFPSHAAQVFAHEYAPLRAIANVWEWRDPDNAVYWLIVSAVVAAIAASFSKRFGSALLLLAASVAVVGHARVAAPFAALVCLLGGSELQSFYSTPKIWAKAVVAFLAILVGIRCVDLVNNRPYLREEQVVLFGAGPAWWLPAKATDFVLEHRLPPEVFSTFNMSSYLVWKLGPKYRDFDDGRYIPFGDSIFREQRALASHPLDSAWWTEVAQRRNIRAVIFPLAPLLALGEFPLKQDCASSGWSPVYMDTAAVIFVRRDSLPASFKNAAATGCSLTTPDVKNDAQGHEQLVNAAAIEYLLGHIAQAQSLLAKAERITNLDPALFRLQAQVAIANHDLAAAERDFRSSLALTPADSTWYGLGVLYMNEKRYPEAIAAFKKSAALAGAERYQRLYTLGKAYAIARQPKQALVELSKAQAESPFRDEQFEEGVAFRIGVAQAKAAAYLELGDVESAARQQEGAAR